MDRRGVTNMKWLYAILGVLPFIIGYYSIKNKRELRYASQFWYKRLNLDDEIFASIEVHFPSMLMRYSFQAVGVEQSLTFFNVQRRGDGPWEMKLTDHSWERDLKEREYRIATGDFFSVDDAKARLNKIMHEGNIWRIMGDWYDPSLETAYQRFIHTPDVPVAMLSWSKEEEEQDIALNSKLKR
jgi:hypothetical protein